MDARTDAEIIACSLTSPASFGELFDRHATTMFRYFVRRVGPDDADALLGELLRLAFSRSGTARLVNTSATAPDLFVEVDARLDASHRWADVAAAIGTLPQGAGHGADSANSSARTKKNA